MKKTTKGALAAGAAAVLLLGGAGTLAYWTAEDTIDGGNIEAGSMELTAVTCDANWVEGGQSISLIVPGDTITKQCTGTLTLEGDHIGATVELDDTSVAAAEAEFNDQVDITATMTSPAATISAPGTYNVVIDLEVVFNGPAATNASQNGLATLDELELVATQTHDVTP
ncbi:alternate-type signal peptide domain-containing protein [Microbacterium sp.]|uniref:alternate-type signal peptide domain-containing protein n=1 Tax=Microbacterium sp. TaxID=51671 RepID=UPI0037370A9B